MNVRFLTACAISAASLLAFGGQRAQAQYRSTTRAQGQGSYYSPQGQNQGSSDSYQDEAQTPGYNNQFQGYARQYSQGGNPRGQATGMLTDRMIANWLAAMSKMEIELAQSVEGQSAFRSINKYARDEVQNHRELLQELARFTPNPGAGIGGAEEDEQYQQLGQRGNRSRENEGFREGAQQASYQQAETQRRAESQGRMVNFPQLRREICNEILHSLQSELEHQQGMDFDWTFVGQQCVLHDQFVAEMKVLRRYASPQLRDVIDDALDEARSDERKLTQIMDQLKDAEKREHGKQSSSSRSRNEG